MELSVALGFRESLRDVRDVWATYSKELSVAADWEEGAWDEHGKKNHEQATMKIEVAEDWGRKT